MENKRFNPKKLQKLNNPKRLEAIPPGLIAEKIKIDHPLVIIDWGAGTGLFSRAFSEIYPESRIYACDIAEEMIEWMTANLTSYKNIVPLKMNGNEVPLEDEIADMIVMINLHHELDNHIKILNECSRLLKKNGQMVISDWKKVKTEDGPAFEIRIEEHVVAEQLTTTGFQNVEIFNELMNNYLVIAKKG